MIPIYSRRNFQSLTTLLCILGLAFGATGQNDQERSELYFSLDQCYANFNDGSNQDFSEFLPEVIQGEDCSVLESGNLYREMPTLNGHSCTPGVGGEPAMCVGSDPSCDYNAGSLQSIRIDVTLTPGASGTGTLSSIEFYEQAPPEFNWINGNSGPNNFPTLFAVRVLKNGEEIFVSQGNETQEAWNLRVFNFSTDPAFTVEESTEFNIELLGYCPIGNGADVSAWDIDELRVISNCCPELDGGEITGGPFEFCVGDGEPDMVSGITLEGNVGTNSQWVITDAEANILGLPAMPGDVNFDEAGPGLCLIWHLSFEDGLTGAEVGNNAATDLQGCFSLSNPIEVVRNQPEGGTITGGPFEFCVGDGEPDMVSGIELSGNSGGNSQWVITDEDANILGLPAMPGDVNFDEAGGGICLIWHLSFEDGLTGAEVGNNAATDLEGCYSLSNPIEVIRNQPEGGTLTGGPFTFCVGDGEPDMVSGIELDSNSGANSQWVVTDAEGVILGLPPTPEAVNFDEAGPGLCLIWHLSFEDGLEGAEVGNNAMTDLVGCYSLSNPVEVFRNQPEGGTITGGPFEFCVGDGIPDNVSGIELSGNVGGNSQWVITDADGVILGLPPMPGAVNFDEAGPGLCLIWHLSFEDGLEGAEVGNNAMTDLVGCYSLSNPIEVIRNQPDGGMLTGGPYEFCVGDGQPDTVSMLELTGAMGTNSQWVVTDTLGNILGLPPSPGAVNFDEAGDGVCLIWHLSFEDGLEGAEVGNNASQLEGCFDLSNPVFVIRNQPEGGTITGGPFEFCVGDGEPDMVSGIELSGNSGENSQWVVTDEDANILGLPPMPGAVNFDEAGDGTCLIWHLSFADGLQGLAIGNNAATDLDGCFSLSNPIEVIRNGVDGGGITGGPFEFCVGDGEPDMVSGIELFGNVGSNSQWVVTDAEGVILGLPPTPEAVNFDEAGPGLCLIWHLSFEDGLEGAEVGNNAMTDLVGCYSLSNPIEVFRNQPEGGTITGGPFEFCVGDGEPDMVSGIELSGNTGTNSQWVITDGDANILGLPAMPGDVNFDEAGDGLCLIWHLSFEDGLEGAEVGNNANDLVGCFSLSNPIEVIRNGVDGGELTGGPFEFCVGDGEPDMVTGIELSGNVGTNSQWVVTDTLGEILGLPAMPGDVNFDEAGGGTCLIWHLSFEDGLDGAEVGNNASDLMGCFDLSNPIEVIRIPEEECTIAPFAEIELELYPNPTSGILNLQANGMAEQEVNIEIIDVLGKPHMAQNKMFSRGANQVDVSHLQPGQYWVRVSTPEGTKVKSLLIAN